MSEPSAFLLPPGPPTPKQLEMSLYVPAPDREQRVCCCHCRVATSPAPAGPGHLRAGLEMRDPHGCPGTRGAGEGQREIHLTGPGTVGTFIGPSALDGTFLKITFSGRRDLSVPGKPGPLST